MRNLITASVVFALTAGVASRDALAWGNDGHKVVAGVAERHLSDSAWSELHWILDGESLEDAAIWADTPEVRDNEEYAWLKRLHYVNVPRNAETVVLPGGEGRLPCPSRHAPEHARRAA